MSEDLSFWVENTVVGFLYILVAIFFIFGIYDYDVNDLEILLIKIKDYLTYLFIVSIAFCSIVGYSAQKVLEFIVFKIKPKYKYDVEKEKKILQNFPEALLKRYSNFYTILLLFRHLIICTLLISIALLVWLKNYGLTISISILFLSVFSFTYLLHRKTFNEFKKMFN